MLRRLIVLSAVAVGATGCVSADQYNGLKVRADTLAEQLVHSQSEVNEANARADALNKQIGMQGNRQDANAAMVGNLTDQNRKLQEQYDALNGKYSDTLGKLASQTSGTVLSAPLTSELQKFRDENPDLVDFDASRGIIKFKSDVTFPAGSAKVEAKAREVIATFATILNSPAAEPYNLLIAGHTDDTPVNNKSTIAEGNFDNWYLSAHRAIAVSTELRQDGVRGKRMGVVGYGAEQPMASNQSPDGKAKNRRVEVLIVPSPVSGGATGYAGSPDSPRIRRSRPAPAPAPAGEATQAGSRETPHGVVNK